MQLLQDIPLEDLKGMRVLLRAGLNVPIENGKISSTLRIEKALPSLRYLQESGARTVIISHIGRGGEDSLAPVAKELKKHLPVTFVADILGMQAKAAASAMDDGDILLLENLRADEREEANDDDFAKELAEYGDLFVNDAFEVSHRNHASVTSIPRYLPSVAGLTLAEEVQSLQKALNPPEKSLCILGGAKFETKGPLIKKLLAVYKNVYVCGALANDIFKARGIPVGGSRVSDEAPAEDVLNAQNLLVPKDVTILKADGSHSVVEPSAVEETDVIADLGPESFGILEDLINKSELVLWNGPTGMYEKGFSEWSVEVARALARSKAISIVGGGDTVAAIEDTHLADRLSFISTGGGAMVEFLLEGTLPGIDAVAN